MANYFPLIIETTGGNTINELPSGSFLDLSQSGISNSGNITLNGVLSANGTVYSGNILPLANVTYNLGSNSAAWNSLHVAGNTIYLGTLQLKDIGSNTFAVYTSDGTTQANLDVGSIDVSTITQGTSSIGLAGVNGNAYITVNGTSNVLVVSTNLVDVTGAISATSNITGGNILTSGIVSAGNLSVTGNALVGGDLIVNGNVSYLNVDSFNVEDPIIGLGRGANNAPLVNDDNKDRGTALWYYDASESQAFIGYKNSTGKMFAATDVSITSEVVTVNNYGTFVVGGLEGATASVTGNVTGNYILGNGALLTGVITSVANINNGTSNVTVVSSGGNITVGVGGTSNVAVFATTGAYVTGLISATGNIDGANINGNGSGLSAITGANVTGQVGNALVAGTVYTAAQPNVTSVGTLTSLSSSGNIDGGNLNATGLSLSGNVVSAINSTANIITTGNIRAGNLIGNNLTATRVPFVGTGGVITDSIVMYTDQPNQLLYVGGDGAYIGGTGGFGTVSATSHVGGVVSVTANVTGGNIRTGGQVSATGNITGGNVLYGAGQVSGTGNIAANNIAVTNQISATGNLISNLGLYVGAGALSTGLTNPIIVAQATGLAYIQMATKNTSATGSADLVTYADNGDDTRAWTDMGMTGSGFNDTGYTITNANDGYVFVQGNTDGTGGNLVLATGGLGTAADIVFATGGFLDSNEKMRFISATGQFDIETTTAATNTTTGALRVRGGAGVAGNIYSGGIVTVTGNIVTTANVSGGNVLTGGIVSATGNITGGNVLTGGIVSATGNITGGNVSAGSGQITTSGNITGGNLITDAAVSAASVSASGNITGANVNTNTLVGTGTTIKSTGDINLSTTGNVVVNSTYINGVTNPVQNQDVATKIYVDNAVSTSISYHEPVAAATTTTLATATGGTISYTQPNGAGNGVGALLTTTGSFDLIDTANVQIVGTRILVKNEANAVLNGVYTWANATNIVRSTDTDTYGAGNVSAIGLNDYFFTTGGSVNQGAAFVVGAPTGTITFGTSNIVFSTFSTSQTYTANTAAGISLAGTVINAKVDGTTTAFDGGGNIIVKASATLTTPNIGAATGTSVSVTANITGGNINTGGMVSATGNISGSYILGNGSQLVGLPAGYSDANVAAYLPTYTGSLPNLTGVVTTTANINGGNINTGGIVSATGNVTSIANISGGNVLSSSLIQGVTLSASGNVNGGNLTTPGTVSSTGNITSSGNISGGNIVVTGVIVDNIGNLELQSTVANGNINLTPAGTGIVGVATSLSVTGNISGGNVLGGANVNATTHTGTTVSVTGNITGNTYTGTTVSVTGNVTGAGHIGTIYTNSIINTGANLTGNIGSATGYFNTVFAKATSAQYADLAELYQADADYNPGTVLIFGGEHEVTAQISSHSSAIAGVVSENPSHLMNAGLQGKHVAAVALLGRVPCQVQGTIRKGDLLVASNAAGVAQRLDPACYQPGCIIGKSLEDYNSDQVGKIEIAVGVK